jgi:hypothetical protein
LPFTFVNVHVCERDVSIAQAARDVGMNLIALARRIVAIRAHTREIIAVLDRLGTGVMVGTELGSYDTVKTFGRAIEAGGESFERGRARGVAGAGWGFARRVACATLSISGPRRSGCERRGDGGADVFTF